LNWRSPDVFLLYPGKKNYLKSRIFDVKMARLTLWQVACMLAGAAVGSIVSCDFSASSPTPPHIQDSPAPVGRNFQLQYKLTGTLNAGEAKSVVFSASGEAIVSGDRHRTVKIWNPGGG
jgi:hypothetical protein